MRRFLVLTLLTSTAALAVPPAIPPTADHASQDAQYKQDLENIPPSRVKEVMSLFLAFSRLSAQEGWKAVAYERREAELQGTEESWARFRDGAASVRQRLKSDRNRRILLWERIAPRNQLDDWYIVLHQNLDEAELRGNVSIEGARAESAAWHKLIQTLED